MVDFFLNFKIMFLEQCNKESYDSHGKADEGGSISSLGFISGGSSGGGRGGSRGSSGFGGSGGSSSRSLSGIYKRFDLVIGMCLKKSVVLLIEVDGSSRSDGFTESRSMAGSN